MKYGTGNSFRRIKNFVHSKKKQRMIQKISIPHENDSVELLAYPQRD